jgi:hypothetical protein
MTSKQCKTFRNVGLNPLVTDINGYFKNCGLLIIAFALATLADMYSTISFMLLDGIDVELHPVIRYISLLLGPIWGPVVGKLCQFIGVIIVTLYLKRWARYILIITTVVYSWAAWYNLWGKDMHIPILMD